MSLVYKKFPIFVKNLYFFLGALLITSCGGEGASDKPFDTSADPSPNPITEPECSETAAGKIINCTVTYNGLNRQFSYYLPSSYSSESEDLPLLISLHGGDDTSEANISYTGFSDLAEENEFIALFPQGSVAEDKGSTGWFTGTCDTSEVCDLGYIDFILDSLSSEINLNIDLDRIYATGFSNGAFMAYSLACNLSERIAGIAAVSGSMDIGSISSCNPIHTMPVLHIHGDADLQIPIDGSEYHENVEDVINFWKEFNECTKVSILDGSDKNFDGNAWRTNIYSECLNNVNVEYVVLSGFDHNWPYFQVNSFSNSDIDGSSLIWSFLSRFDINGDREGE